MDQHMFDESHHPDIRIDSHLDGTTGEIIVDYYWKGTNVEKVAVTGGIVRRYAGLTMIQRDLQNAWRWSRYAAELLDGVGLSNTVPFQSIDNRDVGDLIKGLFVAALSYYAKCFNRAEGRRVRLSREMIAKEYQSEHDDFMEYRNTLAAHAGSNELEHVQPYLLLIPPSQAEFDFTLVTAGKQADFSHSGDSKGFSLLIEHVLQLVVDQGVQTAKRIITAARTLPPSIWRKAAADGSPIDLDNALRNIQ
jgi:hypothetical protein